MIESRDRVKWEKRDVRGLRRIFSGVLGMMR